MYFMYLLGRSRRNMAYVGHSDTAREIFSLSLIDVLFEKPPYFILFHSRFKIRYQLPNEILVSSART